jgi:hypothetical protein
VDRKQAKRNHVASEGIMSEFGEYTGCGCGCLGAALAFAIIVWTLQGFPAFWLG